MATVIAIAHGGGHRLGDRLCRYSRSQNNAELPGFNFASADGQRGVAIRVERSGLVA